MRLGDLDALKNRLKELLKTEPSSLYGCGLRLAIEEIDNAPTVDARTADAVQYTLGYQDGFLEGKKICERPQGEWIIVKDERYGDNVKCPFCGKELAGTDLNFCCKCGAKLIGSEKMNGGAE